MATDTAFPFLTTLILLPAGAALLCALLPKTADERTLRWWTVGLGATAMTATLALAVTIMVRFHSGYAGFQMQTTYHWIPSWGVVAPGRRRHLAVLAGDVGGPVPPGPAGRHRPPPVAVVRGMAAAPRGRLHGQLRVARPHPVLRLLRADAGARLLSSSSVWGSGRRSYAAVKFFIYTFLGSAFLLVGIVTVAMIHDSQTGHLTFDLLALEHTHLGLTDQLLLFGAFTAAFAVKAPVFPFHTWSPDAYGSSPAGGAVILAGIMAKLGTYGIIRFDLTLFPERWSTWLRCS